MRPNESIDYEAVLADLRERRSKIDAAIEAIEQLVMGQPRESGVTRKLKHPASTEVEDDTFFKLSTPDAAEKYLRMRGKPSGTREIAKALIEGGFETSAKNFYANLYTALGRSDAFVKVGKKWGLAEWYPGGQDDDSRPGQNQGTSANRTSKSVEGGASHKPHRKKGGGHLPRVAQMPIGDHREVDDEDSGEEPAGDTPDQGEDA